jgi:hypothetical protein
LCRGSSVTASECNVREVATILQNSWMIDLGGATTHELQWD